MTLATQPIQSIVVLRRPRFPETGSISPFSFQRLTNSFFRNSFPLIFIQIAPGGRGSKSEHPAKDVRPERVEGPIFSRSLPHLLAISFKVRTYKRCPANTPGINTSRHSRICIKTNEFNPTRICTYKTHSKQRTSTLIESTLTRFVTLTPLESALTKKVGGEGGNPMRLARRTFAEREVKTAPLLAPRKAQAGGACAGALSAVRTLDLRFA